MKNVHLLAAPLLPTAGFYLLIAAKPRPIPSLSRHRAGNINHSPFSGRQDMTSFGLCMAGGYGLLDAGV